MSIRAIPANGRYTMLTLMTLAQAGASIFQQGFGVLAPWLTTAFVLSHQQLGLLAGLMLAGSAGSAALAGLAVDAYGERRILLASGFIQGIALCAAAAVPTYAWLAAWLVVFGIGYSATTPAGGRAVLMWFRGERALAMGVRQTGVPLGGIVGALMLPSLAALGGYRLALVVAGLLAMVVAVATALGYRRPEGHGNARRSFRAATRAMVAVAKDPRFVAAIVTCAILSAMQACMLTFLTQTLVIEVELSVAAAAVAMAAAQGGAVGGRLFWGYVSDRYFGGDRMRPLAITLLVAGGGALAIARLSPHAAVAAVVVAIVYGFAGAGWNGLFATVTAEIGGPDRAGGAIGVALTFIFGIPIIAVPLFGALADAHGLPYAWTALAVLSLCGLIPALVGARLMRA